MSKYLCNICVTIASSYTEEVYGIVDNNIKIIAKGSVPSTIPYVTRENKLKFISLFTVI